jgi:hypothetical protein
MLPTMTRDAVSLFGEIGGLLSLAVHRVCVAT